MGIILLGAVCRATGHKISFVNQEMAEYQHHRNRPMGFRSALVRKIRPYSFQDSESKQIGILFWKIAVPDPTLSSHWDPDPNPSL